MKQVEEECITGVLRTGGALGRSTFIVGNDEIAARLRSIRPTSLVGENTRF